MTQEKICSHLGFGQGGHVNHFTIASGSKSNGNDGSTAKSYPISDTLYQWNDQLRVWSPAVEISESQAQLVTFTTDDSATEPIEASWELLMDIDYELRYFSQLEMEIYAPVFPRAVSALDGKEVVVEGFIIPIDEEEEQLALSYNPFASCFFCGQGSPASVMNMYLRDKSKRYRLDDYKKFRGKLRLNQDDPYEFYYILEDANEE